MVPFLYLLTLIGTYDIQLEKIEGYFKKTKAIMLHTLGNPYMVKEIKDTCDKYDLWLLKIAVMLLVLSTIINYRYFW